ncbi:Ankyrin repeat protein [Pandoravirus kuranda]|uniref:Ankyrin repeat protein n=2 Tax=Pandoravirus TaxID=2060084 RepID=A0AA95EH87_9VIRU|nr:Ankyrin repeat domain containing protein [Pandoravirus neocaledonia]AVK76339.1 Ankyrin repeat domain containing protein [Pandoravirus neocaledonia]WBR14853.1 Ankyrin repeat protein [Pandoravirus kuranda]
MASTTAIAPLQPTGPTNEGRQLSQIENDRRLDVSHLTDEVLGIVLALANELDVPATQLVDDKARDCAPCIDDKLAGDPAAWFALLAAHGGLDVLQWARANGCPWDEAAPALAAMRGHFDTIKWLHANGCPWDANTCAEAVLAGHSDILVWLRDNGCPRDMRTWRWARLCDRDVVWVETNGCPRDDHGHDD